VTAHQHATTMPDRDLLSSRRSFLGVGAGAALFCTIGGEQVDLARPGAARRADALAARVPRPPAAARTAQELPRPEPAPGGVRREYWIQARTAGWNIVPTGRDDWHGRRIGGKTAFRAYLYQEMTPGFAAAKGGLSMPGPTLYAEADDVLVVHFRNADTRLRQAVTMHPHGVRYSPEYDGAYLGRYSRAGGFVGPGGTGILLLGGRTNRIEGNRVFGNFLAGVAAVEGILLDKTTEARALIANEVTGNAFGAGGEDRNGRDLAYDGNGTRNCWGPNDGVQTTLPAEPAAFPGCPFGGANAFSSATQAELLGYAGANALKGWIRYPHKPRAGVEPLEVYAP